MKLLTLAKVPVGNEKRTLGSEHAPGGDTDGGRVLGAQVTLHVTDSVEVSASSKSTITKVVSKNRKARS